MAMAEITQRAEQTTGLSRGAERLPQFHPGLVEVAHVLGGWAAVFGGAPEPVFVSPWLRVPSSRRSSRDQDASHVGIDDGQPLERLAEDGTDGVATQPGTVCIGSLSGKGSSVFMHHHLNCLVQMPPGDSSLGLPSIAAPPAHGLCESSNGGEPCQELREERNDRRHLGLLQHHLADPDGIRITAGTPGQVTLVGTNQASRRRRRLFFSGRR